VTDRNGDERVRSVVEQPLAEQGFEVVDVERLGSVLRVTVVVLVGHANNAGRPAGVDLEAVTEATRLVNDLLDAHDLVGERTTLEVSSPGIERPLRTPEHFRRFVGTEVAVKLRPTVEGERRLAGVLQEADDDGVRVAGRRVAYVDIERARTVFVWPPRSEHAGSRRTAAKKMGRAS
jgi:ribosome maturation factor RimP